MRNPFNDYSRIFDKSSNTRKSGKVKAEHNKPTYKGISRIDSEHNHTHGWYVRIRQNGKVKSKFFSDRKYGGITKALMKARRHYKKEMQEVFQETLGSIPDRIPQRIIVTKNKNNNTGIIGVQRIERRNASGSIYRAFRVCWTEKSGKARTKFFSIEKHGEQNAFEMAREFRKAKLLEEV